ncbi:MAG: helix-turn-helix transcriptional regulator [Alphaproteobacteria bacterium]|jgi:transcriptional regulator with XRE-family HTH domain|nr:helix-turn-helix transcriptional regulator [Alphaproteobacteria bacterium]
MARTKNDPHPIDVQVGRRLRQGRALRNMSQQALGEEAEHPVTFQQVQKYERGFNRIAISRLWQFAVVLQLPLSYFLPSEKDGNIPATVPLMTKQEAKLLENFRALPAEKKKAIFALMQSMRVG